MKKTVALLSFWILAASLLFGLSLPAAAEEPLCISDIRLEKGRGAITRLEEEGYIAVYQNLNPSGRGESVYLGYRYGADAITDLRVSPADQDTLVSGTVTYTRVERVNLGDSRDPLYLFETRDPEAGSGILSITKLLVDGMTGERPIDLINDGAVVLKTVDGHAADLEKEDARMSLYFFLVPKELCLPYVRDIRLITVSDPGTLFDAVVSSGCAYYEEEPILSAPEGDIYLCYDRTADSAEAITFAAAADEETLAGLPFESAGSFSSGEKTFELLFTGSPEVGSPVAEITVGEKMSGSFTKGEWAEAYFGGAITSARASLYQSEEYAALTSSGEIFTQSPVSFYENGEKAGETGLYLIWSEEALPLAEETEEAETAPEESEAGEEAFPGGDEETGEIPEEEVIPEEDYLSDGQVHDTEEEGFVKEEETEEEEESVPPEEADEALGSVIGRGSLIAIAVLAISAVAAAFIAAVIRGRKAKKEE